jgi:hypothetical protein
VARFDCLLTTSRAGDLGAAFDAAIAREPKTPTGRHRTSMSRSWSKMHSVQPPSSLRPTPVLPSPAYLVRLTLEGLDAWTSNLLLHGDPLRGLGETLMGGARSFAAPPSRSKTARSLRDERPSIEIRGARTERAIVRALQAQGFMAMKINGMFKLGADINVPLLGVDRAVEMKCRAAGSRRLYAWLDQRDVLIVKSDRHIPANGARDAALPEARMLAAPGCRRLPTRSRGQGQGTGDLDQTGRCAGEPLNDRPRRWFRSTLPGRANSCLRCRVLRETR